MPRLVKVVSRRATEGNKSMWGTLHFSPAGSEGSGWLCDSWTEFAPNASEALRPKMYWLSRDDDKFHHVRIDIPIAGESTISVGPVDAFIKPSGEAFMRAHTKKWKEKN